MLVGRAKNDEDKERQVIMDKFNLFFQFKNNCSRHILFIFLLLSFCRIDLISNASISISQYIHQTKQRLTIEDIKKNYQDDRNINDITVFKDKYVLVEWQQPRNANRFDLYNLDTGSKEHVYGSFYYVNLEEIVSENWFVFLADGRNNINAHVSFPFILEYKRGAEGEKFREIRAIKYFPIENGVEFGDLKNQTISDISITQNGIKILFEPLFEHYAGGGPDVPPIKTAYNEDKHQFIIIIEGTQPRYDLHRYYSEFEGSGFYLNSIRIKKDGSNSKIILTMETNTSFLIESPAAFYTGQIGKEITLGKRERSYVIFTFSSEPGPEHWWIK